VASIAATAAAKTGLVEKCISILPFVSHIISLFGQSNSEPTKCRCLLISVGDAEDVLSQWQRGKSTKPIPAATFSFKHSSSLRV
jgi:hypothetical protein